MVGFYLTTACLLVAFVWYPFAMKALAVLPFGG